MAEKLTDTQLSAIVAQQIELARTNDERASNGNTRAKQLDYFMGDMDSYVPPEPNRSRVVSRDVADTINWLMPEIMKIFTASRRMFLAQPEEPEDLDYADEVTDGLNHVFWKQNFGYGVVYDGTFDALLHGDGIVKTYFDDTPVYGPAKYHDGLTEDQLAMLVDDDNVEVLAQTQTTVSMPSPVDPMQMVEMPAYDVKVRVKKAPGSYVVSVIPRDEFLMDSEATTIESAGFKDHHQRKTRSDLVQMGYDKALVWSIPEAGRKDTAEQQARDGYSNSDANDESMQIVDYHECFLLVDADGDGVAELVRACYGGPGGSSKGELLDWEVWEDEDPFDNIPCEPIPHRFGARAISDDEIDIQDVKTVLWRQLLNNTYWTNNPQRFVAGKVKNPDQLDNPTFGGTVFGDPGTTISDLNIEYIGDKALAAINYADEVSARRTGVNSQSMALDPEVLQNQSATANQNAVNASHSQPELIARNMAEYGWSKVGRKLLRLMNKHETQPRTILVKKKPVQIDPRNWNPDMHVNINTGLGTGSRDKDAMMLGQVLGQQIAYTDRIGAVFPDKALDMLPFIHNTLTQFAESTGLKTPELYWPDLDPAEIEQGKQVLAQRANQPPPEQVKAELDAKNKDAQAQRDHEYRMAQVSNQLQLDQQAAAYQNEQQVIQINGELALKREQLDAELRLKRELGYAEMAVDQELGAAASNNSGAAVHVGGDPG